MGESALPKTKVAAVPEGRVAIKAASNSRYIYYR